MWLSRWKSVASTSDTLAFKKNKKKLLFMLTSAPVLRMSV